MRTVSDKETAGFKEPQPIPTDLTAGGTALAHEKYCCSTFPDRSSLREIISHFIAQLQPSQRRAERHRLCWKGAW